MLHRLVCPPVNPDSMGVYLSYPSLSTIIYELMNHLPLFLMVPAIIPALLLDRILLAKYTNLFMFKRFVCPISHSDLDIHTVRS